MMADPNKGHIWVLSSYDSLWVCAGCGVAIRTLSILFPSCDEVLENHRDNGGSYSIP